MTALKWPRMKVEKYIEDTKTYHLYTNDNDSDTTNLHVHVIPGWDQGPYVRDKHKALLKRLREELYS